MTNNGGRYYHFTDYDLWEKVISKEGLVPQRLVESEITDAMKKIGLNGRRGLWVWDRRNQQLVIDFFMHRVITRGFARGIFLKIRLKPCYLLSELSKIASYRPDFTHDLTFQYEGKDIVAHRDVPFDIYVRPVPPEDIEPLIEIGIEVKKSDKEA